MYRIYQHPKYPENSGFRCSWEMQCNQWSVFQCCECQGLTATERSRENCCSQGFFMIGRASCCVSMVSFGWQEISCQIYIAFLVFDWLVEAAIFLLLTVGFDWTGQKLLYSHWNVQLRSRWSKYDETSIKLMSRTRSLKNQQWIPVQNFSCALH